MVAKTKTNDLPSNTAQGRVRVDDKLTALLTRLEAGDIAVIDVSDMDHVNAEALVERGVVAVLNASRMSTGRHMTLAPSILLQAGIVVVDDLGLDVMELHEGEKVSVSDGSVKRADQVVATGRMVTTETEEQITADSKQALAGQVEGFAASLGDYFERDAALLTDGQGIPALKMHFAGRVAMVVMPGASTRSELRSLKRWIRDTNPLIVAVDGATETVLSAHLKPDVIVGDMDLVPDKGLTSGAQLVVRSGHDGVAPGKERLDRKGLSYEILTMAGGTESAALVLVRWKDPDAIVTVGGSKSIKDFLDRNRSTMVSAFFATQVAGDRIATAQAVIATYRPRIAWGWLLLMLMVAVVAVVAAIWITPWGQDVWTGLVTRISAASPNLFLMPRPVL